MKNQQTSPTSSPPTTAQGLRATLGSDLLSGAVVFLVALPLCLGIALASGAPLISGIISGIIGGVFVGLLSGSHVSVSGPAAGLVAIVLAQIAALGSFSAFLLAVMFAGVLQLGLGLARTGALASFVPTSVIKGLLAAIGVILVLKQIPHVFGHDADPQGDMAFAQPDRENTFSELFEVLGHLHLGAAVIGLVSLALLIVWSRYEPLKKSRFPAPLAVVLLGLAMSAGFSQLGGPWAISTSHLVQVPEIEGLAGLTKLLCWPDFTQWTNPGIYTAALTIAVVASLETLLNLEAVDRLDPQQRNSPPNRELLAQGAGNILAGLVGGLPITSVVIRGSVNINSGAKTKASTIIHGTLLLVMVVGLPWVLNYIPLSCLAAILLITGFRLASPKVARQMWDAGRDQFIPFLVTVIAIVLTDLLVGLGIGMAVALLFILSRQIRRPVRRIVEKHLGREVLHIELAEQVTFLNQTALDRVLDEIPRDSHVLLDAQNSSYIDPDVLALIRDFRDVRAPARNVQLSMIGFNNEYELDDEMLFVDYSTRELQAEVSPAQVLEILRQGNQRFVEGRRLNRDLARQVGATAEGQHPLAVVLSCIDSRTPAELLFDMGLGDVFSVRVAGNVLSPKVLGSMEYGCEIAGSRLIAVVGHTRCGAVTAAVHEAVTPPSSTEPARCQHLHTILEDIQASVDPSAIEGFAEQPPERQNQLVDEVARRNVISVVKAIISSSETIARLVADRRIAIVGALYDVTTGAMDFMIDDAIGLERERER
jgi:MFS superfamily sulfate permease-like transporter